MSKIRRAALGMTSALLTLAILETLIALFWPQPTWRRLMDGRAKHFSMAPVFAPSEYLPFVLKPGAHELMNSVDFTTTWTVNQSGYREPERTIEKAPEEIRVLAIGDSFTAGHGVENHETWPAQLETILKEQLPTTRVINAGYASGYSPDCYYAFCVREIDRLRPDVIVIALFAGNDSWESCGHFYPELDQEGLPVRVLATDRWVDEAGRRRLAEAARPHAYQFPVLRDSHLWVFAARSLTQSAARPPAPHSPFAARYDATMEDAYKLSVRCLLGVQRLAKTRNCSLVVAMIPDCVQLDPSISHWSKLEGRDLDFELPQSRWTRDLGEAEIERIDLRPALQVRAPLVHRDLWRLYYPNDRHFTAAGQEVCAETIAERIRDLFKSEARNPKS
jgi:lysophospholipase L1-like esterase